MPRLRATTRRAFRRSKKLVDAVDALARSPSPVDAVALARAIRVPPLRLLAMMRGERPDFSPDRSPVRIGLVREVRGPFGPAFVLTPEGRCDAAMLEALRTRGLPL